MKNDDMVNLMKRDGVWDYFALDGDSVGILMLINLCRDVVAIEREACAEEAQKWSIGNDTAADIARALRRRS